MKWASDLRRTRRVSREQLDADFAEDSLFWRGEDAALADLIDGVPIGPRTIETAAEVETLLRGLEVRVEPSARVTDQETAHLAAAKVKRSNGLLISTIRRHVADSPVPLSAFEIARQVARDHQDRWGESTIRSAVSRAGLRAVDVDGLSPRGQRCCRYIVQVGETP